MGDTINTADAARRETLLRKLSGLNSSSQVGTIARRVGHDLRGPLSILSGFFEMELKKQASAETRQELQEMAETVDSMAAMLHGLTRFSRPPGPSAEDFPLDALLSETRELVLLLEEARGASIALPELPPGNPLVSGCRAELQQAVFNVMKNAVEAVAPAAGAGEVRVSVVPGPKLRLRIADNGPGLPPEAQASLFKSAFSTKPGHPGLGLLLARDMLVSNGGDLAVRPGEGGGVLAELVLPVP